MLSRLRATLGRKRFESEMQSEMESHIELRVADLIARGIPRIEAERRARAEFGSVEAAKDDCRDASGVSLLDEFQRNLRYAIRILRKSPGFTLAAVATLGLCIGANTAIFSVVDAVLLRPLPYPAPDRLAQVVIRFERQGAGSDSVAQTGRTWAAIKDSATAVEAAVYSGGAMGVTLDAEGAARHVQRRRVSAGFFRVLGVQPFLGREFTEEEDRDGAGIRSRLDVAALDRTNARPSARPRCRNARRCSGGRSAPSAGRFRHI